MLNAYERANAEQSIAGRRWSIEHAFIGRPDHLPRIKALGVALVGAEPPVSGRAEPGEVLGPGARGITTPVRIYLDAGLPVSSGTDAPVVPYPPLWTLYHFVTRDTIAGGVLGADQRMSRASRRCAWPPPATRGSRWRSGQGLDRARQARRPRGPQRRSADLPGAAAARCAGAHDDRRRQGRRR